MLVRMDGHPASAMVSGEQHNDINEECGRGGSDKR